MNEMVERVAEAIYRSQEWDFASDERFSDLTEGAKNVFRTSANAAIEAMREPTKDMMKAAELSLDENTIGRPRGIINTYQAMIDVALEKEHA